MHTRMAAFLYLTFSCLVIPLAGVYARAMDTTITARPTSRISSSMLSNSVNATDSPQRCINIDNCRTLNNIIQSCLVTILACVWFAVHRNIPAPKPMQSRHQNFFVRCAKWVRRTVLDQREAAIGAFCRLPRPRMDICLGSAASNRGTQLGREA